MTPVNQLVGYVLSGRSIPISRLHKARSPSAKCAVTTRCRL
ncbi:MAG: hypothetical protein ACLVJH_01325 [Faecalibacterium prausnitzii]